MLEVVDRPEPNPRADEVVVEVHAAAINPRDWMMREGRYPFQPLLPKKPFVTGSDLSGVVVARGRKVDGFALGQPVFGMVPSSRGFGAHGERVAVPAAVLAPKPDSVSHAEAAGLPLAGLTAYQGLCECGRLAAGQRVLILGASGGVGTYAVQIARQLGARVTGVSSEANRALVAQLGAESTLDYRSVDPLSIETLQDGEPYDLVYDVVGKASLGASRAVLAKGGTYVTTIPRGPQLLEMARSYLSAPLTLVGRRLRRARAVMVRSDGRQLRRLAQWMAEGTLRTVIDSTYPLEAVADAHRRSRTFRSRGKIVLTVR